MADVTNFAQAAERAAGGRDIFGGRSSADRKVNRTLLLTIWAAVLLTPCLCLTTVSTSSTWCQGQQAPAYSDGLPRFQLWHAGRGCGAHCAHQPAGVLAAALGGGHSRRPARVLQRVRAAGLRLFRASPPELPARAGGAAGTPAAVRRLRGAQRLGTALSVRTFCLAAAQACRCSAFDSSLSAVYVHSRPAGVNTAFKLS